LNWPKCNTWQSQDYAESANKPRKPGRREENSIRHNPRVGIMPPPGGLDTTELNRLWAALDDKNTPAPPKPDVARQRRRLWADLEDKNAVAVYQAMCRLIAAPRQAVTLLKERLLPAPPRDVKLIRGLIEELDSEQFSRRDAAAKELAKLCYLAEPELRETLKTTRSFEVRRQVLDLLKFPTATIVEPGYVRQLRAIQLLERIGSREAREVLKTVASGEPLAKITHEARAALNRLDSRQSSR
jgi:hypothetical protein